jgi:hypothetical protein
MGLTKADYPAMNQRSGCCHPLEQKAVAGPTVSESRE